MTMPELPDRKPMQPAATGETARGRLSPRHVPRKSLKIATSAGALALSFGLGAVTTGMTAKPADAATTPQSCLQYIDLSGDVIKSAANHFGYLNDAITALRRDDTRAFQRALDGFDSVTKKVNESTPTLATNARDCRAGK